MPPAVACAAGTPPGPSSLSPASRALSTGLDKVTPRLPWTEEGRRVRARAPARVGVATVGSSARGATSGLRVGACGRRSAAPGPARHGVGEATGKGLRCPAPLSARRCSAARPAALHGAAARRGPGPGPQRPAGPGPPTARAAPTARAGPAARCQPEAGDVRAQRAPSAAGGRRERDAGAGLLPSARASPP